MQQEIDALKIALLQDNDEAGQAAAVALLGAFALLFERGVQALETIASAVEPASPANRGACVRHRQG